MVQVTLNVPLLTELTGAKRFFAAGGSVTEVLEHLYGTYPGFKEQLLQKNGSFQGYLLVTAKYAGESSASILKEPRNDRKGLIELLILPIPHGG